jgi:adrenodoxin-NADP+ reductase
VPLPDVAAHYNAIIFSYGASLSNPLASVSGSSSSDSPLGNVYPALAFVGWYNGHPAFADLNPDLSSIKDVDVVGQGNVALDVARILLSPLSALEKSDLPQGVLDTLAKSGVQRVRAVGRRGPAQVAFTTKELREMVKLGVNFPGVDVGLMAQAKEMAKGDRARTRMLGLMDKPVEVAGGKTFELAFLRSPTAFLPDTGGKVGGVEWAINELVEGERGMVARQTDARETSVAQMVVESVGYRSEPIDGASAIAPFDTKRGRLNNERGRVLDDNGHVNGAYAAGWVARGPVGVIATTMQDAYGLVDALLEDYGEGWADRPAGSPIPTKPEEGIPEAVERGLKDGSVVDIPRWLRIDEAEKELGKKTGREEREKFRTVGEMLEVLG